MNKIKIMLGLVFAAMVLAACSKEDNPVEPTVNLDNPQELVTDQPANAPAK